MPKMILSSLEREWRRAVGAEARKEPLRPAFVRDGIVALFASPFILSAGIFVPFFGQVLVVLIISLLLFYLWTRRSFFLALSVALGASIGMAILGFFAANFGREAAPLYYVLMAFSVFVSGSVLCLLAGGLSVHFERARLRLQSRNSASA